MKCGGCKWRKLIKYDEYYMKDYSECHHPKVLSDDYERRNSPSSDAAGIDDTYYRLEVGMNFGCIHFEPEKENKK